MMPYGEGAVKKIWGEEGRNEGQETLIRAFSGLREDRKIHRIFVLLDAGWGAMPPLSGHAGSGRSGGGSGKRRKD
jgi:hypothetical protein